MGTLSALAASISTFVLAATVITTGMMDDRLGLRKVLIAGIVAWALLKRFQKADPPHTTDAHPHAEAAAHE